MHRVCPVLAFTVRAAALRAAAGARIRTFSSPFGNSQSLYPPFVHRANFAKKSGGKGDQAAESPKAAAGAGGGKASASKAGSKNADSESVNADAEMQAIIAIMK